jgi:pimeloyl-ACP methyl ester carboxylesterase
LINLSDNRARFWGFTVAKLMKKLILICTFFLSLSAFAETDLQTYIAQGCQDFKAKLNRLQGASYGYDQVPMDWKNPSGGKIPLFWWRRAGAPSFPPLLLVHGGPGGNSWGFLLRLPKLIDSYPGDVFSIDQRGEGCSNTLAGNLPPSAYAHLMARNSVYDFEYLRNKFYHGRTWRAFGQSRGSIILHYYLDMFPQALESVHAHGWSLMPANLAPGTTRLRAIGYQRTAAAYVAKYPEDVALVKRIRASITPLNCWPGYESRQYCGPDVLDVFAFDLSRMALWENLHKLLNSVVTTEGTIDTKKVSAIIAERVKSDLFASANYIVATFTREVFYPDYNTLLRMTGTPEFQEPLLSEVRWWRNGILPALPIWRSDADPVDYARIRRFLASHPRFKYYLYSSALDPVAPVEIFRTEVTALAPYVRYTNLQNSGHDGWWSEPLMAQRVLDFSGP